MFSHIDIGQFVLKLKALDEIHLPAYKGSTLRGGFGYALKEVSCALKRQDCKTCMLRDRCVYLYLFETPPPPDTEMMRLYPTAPHPFIIEPPDNGARIVPQGGDFEFGLTVIGRALEYLPYFIYAFLHLGDKGLGSGKGRFVLQDVGAISSNGFKSIYQTQNQSLKKPNPYPTSQTIDALCEGFRSARQINIAFRTPTRIKSEGRLTGEPEFHNLIRSLLRRLSAISYFHCGRKLDMDFKGLIERAHLVERVSSDLQWHDWDRYSSRQKQKMTLGGFLGEATFKGDFWEFLPLLTWGEVLHVGKAASFGLGRYTITSTL
jgi:hypothetical protein